jgi:hypothetical protein
MSRRGALASAWLVALTLAACATSQKPDASPGPPSEHGGGGGAAGFDGQAPSAEEAGAPAYAQPGDELEALQALVDTEWAELEELDHAREKAAAVTAEPRVAAARCDRIRRLADEICTLSDRMCTLATEHPEQARYANACTRSGETCRRARTAAERCPAA